MSAARAVCPGRRSRSRSRRRRRDRRPRLVRGADDRRRAALPADRALALRRTASLDIRDELRASVPTRRSTRRDIDPQEKPLADGRMVSPHDPLLPALAGRAARRSAAGSRPSRARASLAGRARGAARSGRRCGASASRPRTALVVVGVFAASAPLAVYGTQVYPELPGRARRASAAVASPAVAARRSPWSRCRGSPSSTRSWRPSLARADVRRRPLAGCSAGTRRPAVGVPRRAQGSGTAAGRRTPRATTSSAASSRWSATTRTTSAARDGCSACSSTARSASPPGSPRGCSPSPRSRRSPRAGRAGWKLARAPARRRLARRDVRRADDARLVVARPPARRRAAAGRARDRAGWTAAALVAASCGRDRRRDLRVPRRRGVLGRADVRRRLLRDGEPVVPRVAARAARLLARDAWTWLLATGRSGRLYAYTATRRAWGAPSTRAPSGTTSVDGRCETSVVPSPSRDAVEDVVAAELARRRPPPGPSGSVRSSSSSGRISTSTSSRATPPFASGKRPSSVSTSRAVDASGEEVAGADELAPSSGRRAAR